MPEQTSDNTPENTTAQKRDLTTDGIDTVLFDVDGTIIDSTYHHAIAWGRAFARYDLYPQLWRVHRSLGMGGDQLVPTLTSDDVEERLGDDLRDAWEEEYRELLPGVRAFEGAGDAVRAVRAKGLKVALASSGKQEFTEAALEKAGLAKDDFDAITSSDDAEASKPEPDILEVALKNAGGSHGILVGDATWDVESAARTSMPCLGLRSGGFSAAEMREAGAIDVHDSITDLRDGSWLENVTRA